MTYIITANSACGKYDCNMTMDGRMLVDLDLGGFDNAAEAQSSFEACEAWLARTDTSAMSPNEVAQAILKESMKAISRVS